MELTENKGGLRFIWVVSIVIPIAVAVLLFKPTALIATGDWIYFLPKLHAILNSLTAILLIAALVAVKKKNIKLHQILTTTALVLGTLFLVSYVTYHSSADSVIYGDVDHSGDLSDSERLDVATSRLVYIVLLLSHILLSIFVVPFVLLAFYRALTGNIEKHRKIVKWTYPVWLYVSISGVLVYFMISPYYA